MFELTTSELKDLPYRWEGRGGFAGKVSPCIPLESTLHGVQPLLPDASLAPLAMLTPSPFYPATHPLHHLIPPPVADVSAAGCQAEGCGEVGHLG
jgi:hypothetical protein